MAFHYEICPGGKTDDLTHYWLCFVDSQPSVADNLDRDKDFRVEYRLMEVGGHVVGLADDPRFEKLDENVSSHPIAFRLTRSTLEEVVEWVASTKKPWSVKPIFGVPMTNPMRTKVEFCFSDLAAATEAKLKFAAYLD